MDGRRDGTAAGNGGHGAVETAGTAGTAGTAQRAARRMMVASSNGKSTSRKLLRIPQVGDGLATLVPTLPSAYACRNECLS